MIQVEHITKIYDGQRALDDVSFTAKEGEVVGLLGPNGAGKSTLMKILTCYIPPTEGEASVCGHSIYEEPLAVRREIGYLPEHNPLYTDMYVREFLRFAAGVYGMKHCNDISATISWSLSTCWLLTAISTITSVMSVSSIPMV